MVNSLIRFEVPGRRHVAGLGSLTPVLPRPLHRVAMAPKPWSLLITTTEQDRWQSVFGRIVCLDRNRKPYFFFVSRPPVLLSQFVLFQHSNEISRRRAFHPLPRFCPIRSVESPGSRYSCPTSPPKYPPLPASDAPEGWLQVCCQDNDRNDDGAISFREFTPFVLEILDLDRKSTVSLVWLYSSSSFSPG